jgi:hypothetical protein
LPDDGWVVLSRRFFYFVHLFIHQIDFWNFFV